MPYGVYRRVPVLVSAGIEQIVFLVAGISIHYISSKVTGQNVDVFALRVDMLVIRAV